MEKGGNWGIGKDRIFLSLTLHPQNYDFSISALFESGRENLYFFIPVSGNI